MGQPALAMIFWLVLGDASLLFVCALAVSNPPGVAVDELRAVTRFLSRQILLRTRGSLCLPWRGFGDTSTLVLVLPHWAKLCRPSRDSRRRSSGPLFCFTTLTKVLLWISKWSANMRNVPSLAKIS
jgi:hypothetical protein